MPEESVKGIEIFDSININKLLGIDIDTTKKIVKLLQCGKSFLQTFPLQTILFWT